MKKLLIHLGYPKSASTTLQNGLFYELHGRAQFFEVTDAAGTSDVGPVPM